MVSMNFNPLGQLGQLAWQMRRLTRMGWRRVGPWGAALLALLLVVIGLALALHGLETRRAALQTTLARAGAEQEVNEPMNEPVDERTQERAKLQAFHAALPAQADIPDVLQDLMDRAESRGLTLAKGQYQLQEDPVGGFARYHMTLPVRGKGAVVRGFINDALAQHPHLALESVQFSRKRIDAVVVEARIQWVLLLRAAEVQP